VDAADAVFLEHVFNQFGHPQPLAENHRLFAALDHEFTEEGFKLFELRPVHSFMVHKIGVVSSHTHHSQGNLQPPLVNLAQKAVAPPLSDELRHDLLIFIMQRPLLRRQGDQEILVNARR
jgi:hypothetical protein